MTTKQNIEKALWNACDSFRGKIDSSRYKDYILSMLFVKYLMYMPIQEISTVSSMMVTKNALHAP